MYCPGCGSGHNSVEEMYCGNCSSERDANQVLKVYFDRGYPYDAIVGLLAAQGFHMSLSAVKRRLRALGLKRKGIQFDEDHLKAVIQEEMQGAGSLSGYRSIWHALRLRHGIHVSRHVVATLMREIDPLGVEERKKRRLHRRVYKSEGPNACWHLDGRNVFIWEVVQGAAPPPHGLQSRDKLNDVVRRSKRRCNHRRPNLTLCY